MIKKEEEVWKTYPDYPWIEVSQFGEVRTKDRYVPVRNGSKRLIKGRILKQQLNNRGYIYVVFSVNNKIINLYIHRMVATCFIPNPNHYLEVNHKDNDPKNNDVSNLEWCDHEYNEAYKKNFGTELNRPVITINRDTSEVLWFESRNEASRQLMVDRWHITHVIKGERQQIGGYWFCDANEIAVEKARAKFGDEVANKVEKLIREHI